MSASQPSPWSSSYRLIAAEKWKAKSALMGSAVTNTLVEYSRPRPGMRVLDLASGTGEPAISLAERVGLQDLRVIHQTPLLLRRYGNLNAQQHVAGLGAGEHVAHRADSADPRHQPRHFLKRAALAEFFKAAKLRDMEARRFYASRIVELD